MSRPPKDYEVGYGRTPKETRWPKGQSGNRSRQPRVRHRSTVELMERLFHRPIEITLHDEIKKVPTLEAIVRLISQRAIQGDRKALAAQLKYQEFAARYRDGGVQVVFVDNEYTKAVAAHPTKMDGEDE